MTNYASKCPRGTKKFQLKFQKNKFKTELPIVGVTVQGVEKNSNWNSQKITFKTGWPIVQVNIQGVDKNSN